MALTTITTLPKIKKNHETINANTKPLFSFFFFSFFFFSSIFHLPFQPQTSKMAKTPTTKAPKTDLVQRDYTVNLHKRLHGLCAKKRAPRAVKEIKKFASSAMGTKDVRISSGLNKALWAQGIKSVPVRVRVRLSRKRNDDEEAEEKLYTLAEHVPMEDFKGLQNETVV